MSMALPNDGLPVKATLPVMVAAVAGSTLGVGGGSTAAFSSAFFWLPQPARTIARAIIQVAFIWRPPLQATAPRRRLHRYRAGRLSSFRAVPRWRESRR